MNKNDVMQQYDAYMANKENKPILRHKLKELKDAKRREKLVNPTSVIKKRKKIKELTVPNADPSASTPAIVTKKKSSRRKRIKVVDSDFDYNTDAGGERNDIVEEDDEEEE